MPTKKYDWIQLKQEFFASDFLEVADFFRQRFGKFTGDNGNIENNVKGWAVEKQEWKKKNNEEIQARLRTELIEKLKIKTEEVLAAKNIAYNLLIQYLQCQAKELNGQTLTPVERRFVDGLSVGKIDTINKWINIELGLPTHIEEIKGGGGFLPNIIIDL